jgi:hypothetical protein
MRAHVERVRLDTCEKLESALKASERLFRDLTEALDRIPFTVTGRQFVEHGFWLSRGIVYLLEDVLREECWGRADGGERVK